MIKKKPIPTCQFTGCKKNCHARGDGSWNRFCSNHRKKATIGGFISKTYSAMNRRVLGKSAHNRGNWLGKPILPREIFYLWARNNPEFLRLYKQWFTSGFDIKLTPSVNRMNSARGYTLDNMEWITNSQNSGLSAAVKKMKAKKEIYNLLGVKS